MTEAERIAKDADEYCMLTMTAKNVNLIRSRRKDYIAGATTEHERLQQQLKEKENRTPYKYWDEKFKESDKIADLEAELKAAQELNQKFIKILQRSLEPLNSTSEYFAIQNEIKALINKSKSI